GRERLAADRPFAFVHDLIGHFGPRGTTAFQRAAGGWQHYHQAIYRIHAEAKAIAERHRHWMEGLKPAVGESRRIDDAEIDALNVDMLEFRIWFESFYTHANIPLDRI